MEILQETPEQIRESKLSTTVMEEKKTVPLREEPPKQLSQVNPEIAAVQDTTVVDEDPLGFMKQVQAERASQPLYEKVYLQRKVQSMKQLEHFQQTRNKYFLRHVEVLEGVESGLLFKLKNTDGFFQESIHYFEGIRQTYRHFQQNLTKIDAFGRLRADQPPLMWYSSVESGVVLMLKVKDHCAKQSKELQEWLEGTLLHRLKDSFSKFMQTVHSFGNEVQRVREQAADADKACFKKLDRIRKGMQERAKFDLMSEQLELNELYLKFQRTVVEWGRLVGLFWATAQNNEAKLLSALKHTILEFVAELQKVYQSTPQLDDLRQYWQTVELDHEPAFAYQWKSLVKPQHNEIVRSALQREPTTIADLESFCKLEHLEKTIGSPESIIAILSIKKFNVKVALNKDLKEWAPALVFITVDGWLVVQMVKDRTVHNHMQLQRLQNQRTADQIVRVNERIKGILFDSTNKDWLHFDRIDEVEEFLFLTEPDIERKKAYLA